jgi:hypothetical protein
MIDSLSRKKRRNFRYRKFLQFYEKTRSFLRKKNTPAIFLLQIWSLLQFAWLQHLSSLTHAGKRQVLEEVVDVILKALANKRDLLVVCPFFFNLTHIQKLKYAKSAKYVKYGDHTRGACSSAGHQLHSRFWEQIWEGSSAEKGQYHDEPGNSTKTHRPAATCAKRVCMQEK